MTRSISTIAFVTTIPINISAPIIADTLNVSPEMSRATSAPIIVNGSENKIANGASAPPNVTTRTKYTMAIAANIANPSCVKDS